MGNEIEIVSNILCEMNRSRYGPTQPPPSHIGEQPKWYISVTDGAYERFAPASVVWASQEGEIWVESAHLGSTISWVEEEYGESASSESMDIDYRKLTLTQVQSRLKRFPKVYDRIEAYKLMAEEVSRKTRAQVEFLCDGRFDVGWFAFRAQIIPKAPDDLERELRKAVAAMRDVYDLTEGARRRDVPNRS
jgi:hypothetical protein